MADSNPRTDIFQYHNGEKPVWGDPLRIQRLLHLALPDAPAVLQGVRNKDLAAVGKLMEAVPLAFGMKPFDPESGEGATEAVCKAAVEALWAFLASKKKSSAGVPTS